MKILKSILFDIIFWIYFSGCVSYLTNDKINILAVLSVGILVAISFNVLGVSVGRKIFNPCRNSKLFSSFLGWIVVLILLLTIIVGWNLVEVNPYKFFTKFKNTSGILKGLFNPNLEILKISITALAETIYLALLATIFAIPFAFVFSFFAARNLMSKSVFGSIIYFLTRTISTVFRSIEAIVWAIIFSVWVGIGPFAGMLALMVHSVAALTKLYSEQIENIDEGQIEAIKATGASTLQIWIYAVIPQIISPFLAFTIYRWDINVRMATIVGFVGGGGIGLLLLQQQQMLRWHNVGLIMWLIALVVWIMDMVSAKVREKLRNR